MSTEDKLFIHKYQPLYFNDFGLNNSLVNKYLLVIFTFRFNLISC